MLFVFLAGLRKVTDDMKTKNRTDRTGVVSAPEKAASRAGSFSFKTGPPKMELQMGRKLVPPLPPPQPPTHTHTNPICSKSVLFTY